MYSTAFIFKSIGGRIVRLPRRHVHHRRRRIHMHYCPNHHHDGHWHHSHEDQHPQRVRLRVERMLVVQVAAFRFPLGSRIAINQYIPIV